MQLGDEITASVPDHVTDISPIEIFSNISGNWVCKFGSLGRDTRWQSKLIPHILNEANGTGTGIEHLIRKDNLTTYLIVTCSYDTRSEVSCLSVMLVISRE